MKNDPRPIMPGDRVRVFDSSLFEDDISTPLSMTVKPATVVCRYGAISHTMLTFGHPSKYPDLVDVQFDHRPEHISHGHFTTGIDLLYHEVRA